uniref:ATPbinding Cassette (ABC) Superfamily putative n=1 Tax=Albugo laibachii Nc14 TaxID=890382 RepID=F0WRU7_9STRA|nr:ATPbinding Cassette (ABC) Superfamily putative [Albugo laibachii Nc14]|eukprot:CCA24063.1 ATPbinding Cassette (ABC) Superfamily putative [Albugo laibachii Nc14]
MSQSAEHVPLLGKTHHSRGPPIASQDRNKRDLLCLQASLLFLIVIDAIAFILLAIQTFGSSFWTFRWLGAQYTSKTFRFWALPFYGLCVKILLLLTVTLITIITPHKSQSTYSASSKWQTFKQLCNVFLLFFVYMWNVSLIILLAVDAFQLDTLFVSVNVHDRWILAHVKTANSLSLVFTVLELVNLNHLPRTSLTTFFKKKSLGRLPMQSLEGARVEDVAEGVPFSNMMCILRPYFWPKGTANRARACSTYIFLLLSKLLNLLSPLYMAKATNAIIKQDTGAAILALAIFSSMTLGSKLLKELQSLIYLKVKQTAYIELATYTYAHLHALSYDWHVHKKLGDVLRSMDRGVESANSVVSYLFLSLFPTIGEAVVVLVIFAAHFQLASLSFIAFLSLVLYAYLTITITLWRKKFREASNKHDNEYHDRATDALINYETIKYFTNEKYEVESYTDVIRKYQTQSVTVQASLSLLNSSQAFIFQMTILGSLAIAAPYVIRHEQNQSKGLEDAIEISVGDFVAISVYLNNLFQPLAFLGSIYNTIIRAIVDMQKLSELLSIEPDVMDHPHAVDVSVSEHTRTHGIPVSFRNVSFRYPRSTATDKADVKPAVGRGVRDLTFSIPAGTTTALVGETGSGKSTIGRLLFRFYECDRGEILVNKYNIRNVTQHSLRRIIGMVPQDTTLFNGTIYENIKYGNLEATFEQVESAARHAKIYDFIMKLPDAWNSRVGERGLKLSGGEKQRIAIARVVLKNPPFVILDEATSALDTLTEQEIQMALRRLQRNRTMLIIAHRLSTISHANEILVLHEGEIVERGSHEALVGREDSAYARMWHAQLLRNEALYAGDKSQISEDSEVHE